MQAAHRPIDDGVVFKDQFVELVPVYGKVLFPSRFPDVLTVYRDSHEVRHDVCETIVVISLDPNDVHVPLWIRELPDIGEKVPVLLIETGEIQVAEDIAQKDKAAKVEALQ
jgi:hypothetical protein